MVTSMRVAERKVLCSTGFQNLSDLAWEWDVLAKLERQLQLHREPKWMAPSCRDEISIDPLNTKKCFEPPSKQINLTGRQLAQHFLVNRCMSLTSVLCICLMQCFTQVEASSSFSQGKPSFPLVLTSRLVGETCIAAFVKSRNDHCLRHIDLQSDVCMCSARLSTAHCRFTATVIALAAIKNACDAKGIKVQKNGHSGGARPFGLDVVGMQHDRSLAPEDISEQQISGACFEMHCH